MDSSLLLVVLWIGVLYGQRLSKHKLTCPLAICNDGSQAVFYSGALTAPLDSKTVVWLQGGNTCNNNAECRRRQEDSPELMSSNEYPESVVSRSFFSRLTDNYSHVWIPYCSSDLWSGDRGSDGDTAYEFRGWHILQCFQQQFFTQRIAELLVCGDSAGGLGALVIHSHSLHQHVNNLAAGSSPPIFRFIGFGTWFIAENLRLGVVNLNLDGTAYWASRLPPFCHDTDSCFMLENSIHNFQFPIFLVSPLMDAFMMLSLAGWPLDLGPVVDNLGVWVSSILTQTIRNATRTLPNLSVFTPQCLAHVSVGPVENEYYELRTDEDDAFLDVEINGTQLASHLGRWLSEPTLQLIIQDTCVELDCNPTCPVLSILQQSPQVWVWWTWAVALWVLGLCSFLMIGVVLYIYSRISARRWLKRFMEHTNQHAETKHTLNRNSSFRSGLGGLNGVGGRGSGTNTALAALPTRPSATQPPVVRLNMYLFGVDYFAPTTTMDSIKHFVRSLANDAKHTTHVRGKQLLRSVNGEIKPETIIGLIGPSGAGKSSLFNVLTGLGNGLAEGFISANNRPVPYDSLDWRLRMGFAEQHPVLPPRATVLEYLLPRALTVFPTDLNERQVLEKLFHIISLCDLLPRDMNGLHLFEKPCGVLSGGQQKKVCIARALLTDPSLLVLDEPLSGLDAASAIQICKVMQSLSEKGRSIVVSIHQPLPEIIQYVDKFWIIADGETVFFGDTDEAQEYFQNVAFANLDPSVKLNTLSKVLTYIVGNPKPELKFGFLMDFAFTMLEAKRETTISRAKIFNLATAWAASAHSLKLNAQLSQYKETQTTRERHRLHIHHREPEDNSYASQNQEAEGVLTTKTDHKYKTRKRIKFSLQQVEQMSLQPQHVITALVASLFIGLYFFRLDKIEEEILRWVPLLNLAAALAFTWPQFVYAIAVYESLEAFLTDHSNGLITPVGYLVCLFVRSIVLVIGNHTVMVIALGLLTGLVESFVDLLALELIFVLAGSLWLWFCCIIFFIFPQNVGMSLPFFFNVSLSAIYQFVPPAEAPSGLRWLFTVSPIRWTIQGIAMGVLGPKEVKMNNFGTHFRFDTLLIQTGLGNQGYAYCTFILLIWWIASIVLASMALHLRLRKAKFHYHRVDNQSIPSPQPEQPQQDQPIHKSGVIAQLKRILKSNNVKKGSGMGIGHSPRHQQTNPSLNRAERSVHPTLETALRDAFEKIQEFSDVETIETPGTAPLSPSANFLETFTVGASSLSSLPPLLRRDKKVPGITWPAFRECVHITYDQSGFEMAELDGVLERVWKHVLVPLSDDDPANLQLSEEHRIYATVTEKGWMAVFARGLLAGDPDIVGQLFYQVYRSGVYDDDFSKADTQRALQWWQRVNEVIGAARCCSGEGPGEGIKCLKAQFEVLQFYVETMWNRRTEEKSLSLDTIHKILTEDPTLAKGLRLLL